MPTISENWQFLYNDLLFGANTDYELMLIEGLDPAEIRGSVSNRMQSHGSFVYAPFFSDRIIIFKGSSAASPVLPLMLAWAEAFQPQTSDLPLTMWLPGQPLERIYCRPVGKPTYVIDPAFSYGYAEWAIMLQAGNPRIYSDALNSVVVTPTVNGTATNDGKFDAHPLMTLVGPIDTPTINHVESGKFLKLNLLLNAGESAIFDEEARTVKMPSGASLYSSLDDLSKWFQLAPGANTIDLNGTSTTAATQLTVEWRNARV